MNTGYLIRTYHDKCTTGVFVAHSSEGKILLSCNFLELPWQDNQRNVSCIPEGEYIVEQRESKRFGLHYHVKDVPGRSGILQHPGNYTHQIQGCQLPGQRLTDLNDDGIPDIIETRLTLNHMLQLLGKQYKLVIWSHQLPSHPHTISPKNWTK